jgi:hypothetical protein
VAIRSTSLRRVNAARTASDPRHTGSIDGGRPSRIATSSSSRWAYRPARSSNRARVVAQRRQQRGQQGDVRVGEDQLRLREIVDQLDPRRHGGHRLGPRGQEIAADDGVDERGLAALHGGDHRHTQLQPVHRSAVELQLAQRHPRRRRR